MNGLRIIVDARCIFHKNYFEFYNRDWNSNLRTKFGMTCGKCFCRYCVEIEITEISKMNF